MDSTVLVAIITSGLAFLGVVVTNVLNFVANNKRAKEAREAADENRRIAKETQAAVERNNNTLQEKLIEDGVQCLLRAEIIRSNEKYLHKGYCPIYAKESLKRVYDAYHALGGNDVATHLYNELMELQEEPV